MATNPRFVEQLEEQAARERDRLGRRIVGVRRDLERRLDFRRRAEQRIHARPAATYGAAAAAACLAGYLFARLLKM